jgi:hypothetical protein
MKFDSLVSYILEQNQQENRYIVEFDSIKAEEKYGFKRKEETIATDKKSAIRNVIMRKLSEMKTPSNRIGYLYVTIKNECGPSARIKPLPAPVKPQVKQPETNPQMELGFHEEAFDLEKKEGLHGWFKRNKGKGWVNCKKSRPGHIVPCGREKGTKKDKGYPACRPTLSMCSGSKNKKKGHKSIKWKKKS